MNNLPEATAIAMQTAREASIKNALPKPPNFMVVDVSHWVKPLPSVSELEEARALGLRGIIAKATEGASWRDDTFPLWRALAGSAGLLFGSYHFATTSNTAAQLKNYLSEVAPQGLTYIGEIFALDCERTKGREPVAAHQILELARGIANATGKFPLIYGGQLLKEYFGTHDKPSHDPKGIAAALSAFPLWLCQYNVHYVLPAPWNSCKLWQWTDGSNSRPENWHIKLPGFHGPKLDLNHFEGSEAELRAFWGVRDNELERVS